MKVVVRIGHLPSDVETMHPCGADDTESLTKELLNKVVIFVFFAYKIFSRRFI